MEFPLLNLRFQFKGELVKGVLSGNIIRWQFESDSKIFLTYIPEGIINHKTLLKGGNDKRLPIIESTLTAIDRIVELVE